MASPLPLCDFSELPCTVAVAKKLVDMSSDPREWQWLHQRFSLAVVKGNAASILACIVYKFDLMLAILHSQCVKQWVLLLTTCLSSMNSYCFVTACIFCKLYCLPYVWHLLSVSPLCCTVLFSFLAILRTTAWPMIEPHHWLWHISLCLKLLKL